MTATYLVLNLIIMGVVIAAFRLRFPRPVRPMLVALGALLLLTLVFDNIMIILGLFTYNPERISGLQLYRAPIEDFMYPVLAFLLVPALWARFSSDRKDDDVRDD